MAVAFGVAYGRYSRDGIGRLELALSIEFHYGRYGPVIRQCSESVASFGARAESRSRGVTSLFVRPASCKQAKWFNSCMSAIGPS